jgi:hypothetical protein
MVTRGPPNRGKRTPDRSRHEQAKINHERALRARKAQEVEQEKEEETPTLTHPGPPPQIDPSASMDKSVDQAGKSAIQDKWWFATFLVHTLGYLGASAWINYTTVTNDKQPVTEDSDLGPIDTYVWTTSLAYASYEVIMLSGAVIIGFGVAFIAFAVSPILIGISARLTRSWSCLRQGGTF